MRIAANQLQFEIIDEGLAHQPAVLFICGMGMQLIGWPKEFINGISSRGYRAIRYDNRDIGLSSPMDHLGIPNFLLGFLKYKIGMQASPPYSLQDMAIDGLKILETLGIQKAHLIGVSMGGMIAQRMAITAPDKIFSLTSLMSSSSAEHLSGPQPDVLSALMVKPAAPGSEQAKLNALKFMNSLRSPGFPYPPGYFDCRHTTCAITRPNQMPHIDIAWQTRSAVAFCMRARYSQSHYTFKTRCNRGHGA